MNKLKVGDVVKISVRKRSYYMVVSLRENEYLLRKVNKQFMDCGNKSTFRVPFTQMEQIFEEKVGEGSPNGSGASIDSPKGKKASELIEENSIFEETAAYLLKIIAAGYSPENLTCDGELTRAQVNAKKSELDRKWKAMEIYFDCKIENDLA